MLLFAAAVAGATGGREGAAAAHHLQDLYVRGTTALEQGAWRDALDSFDTFLERVGPEASRQLNPSIRFVVAHGRATALDNMGRAGESADAMKRAVAPCVRVPTDFCL